jgi:hypothetical protein
VRFLRILLAALLLYPSVPFSAPAHVALESGDSASLRTIDAWLKSAGREGWLAAEVADVAGIRRAASEGLLQSRQRGYRSGDVLRIAQTSAEAGREFLVFMVQRPGDEVQFYFATPRDGLKKAFVSSRFAGVLALPIAEAASGFREELRYWEERVAGR